MLNMDQSENDSNPGQILEGSGHDPDAAIRIKMSGVFLKIKRGCRSPSWRRSAQSGCDISDSKSSDC